MRVGATIACGVLVMAGWSCLAPESGDSAFDARDASDVAGGAPLVGRLQYHDRVVDLTVDAFADGPNGAAVDPSSYAKLSTSQLSNSQLSTSKVMADIDRYGRESLTGKNVRGSRTDEDARSDVDSPAFAPNESDRLDFRRRR